MLNQAAVSVYYLMYITYFTHLLKNMKCSKVCSIRYTKDLNVSTTYS